MADLVHGREAFERKDWADAFAQFSAADAAGALGAEDLERLALAAYLTARDTEAADAWGRAHAAHVEAGEPARGARCAFWNGTTMMLRGEMGPAMGWFGTAERALADVEGGCGEQGLLMVTGAVQNLMQGNPAQAQALAREAAAIAERFRDPDAIAMARSVQGQVLIALGDTPAGIALMDESMVAATSRDVSPLVAGLVYCAMILACRDAFDLKRAQQWTSALSDWCEEQPDLVPYRGQCLVHRSQIMHLHGEWAEALDEAHRARDRLLEPTPGPAIGLAYYQLGEIHRLRGGFSEAEESYRLASDAGHNPHPGLALLRLAQGKADAASGAIRRVLDETAPDIERAQQLPAAVEIALATDDLDAASAAAEELTSIAERIDVELINATSAYASGTVRLAAGDARSGLEHLRRAEAAWRELEAPYEVARTRVGVGLACRALGDEDTASLELDAARRVFRQVGARPDLERLTAAPKAAGGLTARELEVLTLVAKGQTNRAIAGSLVISEKTVARHVSNIFTKLGVSSRSAATAYAYEHDLV